jgi:Flp pilus assembly protein TadB
VVHLYRAGQNVPVTTPERPFQPPTDGTHWWIKPAVVAVLNIAAVLILITFVIGWSTSVLVVVLGGLVLGTWWFLNQRPDRH